MGGCLLILVIAFPNYEYSVQISEGPTTIWVTFASLYICLKAIWKKSHNANIILIGLICSIICLVGLYLVLDTYHIISWNDISARVIQMIGTISIPLSISVYLGGDFAHINRVLGAKSKEVQQLSTEKHRIATDIHDDIGSDLSALNMQIERIREKAKTSKQPLKELDNLVESSRDIAKKVREVIWTINARHDTLSSIINYFDLYAEDFFEPTDIVVRTSIPTQIPDVVISGDSRKVLLMCFKETLNNAYKHAHATEIHIAFTTDNHLLTITIADNGVGFDPVLTQTTANGNGLVNLQERMTSIGGHCAIQTSQQGTAVNFSLPI